MSAMGIKQILLSHVKIIECQVSVTCRGWSPSFFCHLKVKKLTATLLCTTVFSKPIFTKPKAVSQCLPEKVFWNNTTLWSLPDKWNGKNFNSLHFDFSKPGSLVCR